MVTRMDTVITWLWRQFCCHCFSRDPAQMQSSTLVQWSSGPLCSNAVFHLGPVVQWSTVLKCSPETRVSPPPRSNPLLKKSNTVNVSKDTVPAHRCIIIGIWHLASCRLALVMGWWCHCLIHKYILYSWYFSSFVFSQPVLTIILQRLDNHIFDSSKAFAANAASAVAVHFILYQQNWWGLRGQPGCPQKVWGCQQNLKTLYLCLQECWKLHI